MSHSRGGLEFSPMARKDGSSLVEERLAARQAKRAIKAEERRKKSDALKEEGNALFRRGNFHAALERYQQAIDVHGPSAKPVVLLCNVAASYLQLGMYSEAHEAADRALDADPKSMKARYRRAMARKNMEMWTAAELDFRMVLTLDPGNKAIEAELAFLHDERDDLSDWALEEEDLNSYSDYEAPALEDDPRPGESPSESSDCEHTGNGIPCKFYNRTECKHGRACRFSHAPDEKSERDALGRNVCRYYLIGVCKYGERCSYLHSKEYLLQKGWWSTTEGVDSQRNWYNFGQKCKKAIAEYNSVAKASGTGQNSKKRANGKKKRSKGTKSAKKPAVCSYPTLDEYSSDADDENGMCGFTGSEVDELLCQGVKPWDDDAWDVLDALHSHY